MAHPPDQPLTAAERARFFQQVTLQICSSLEIHVALGRAFAALKAHLPIDRLYLERYDTAGRGMRALAWANAQGAWPQDALVPLSRPARDTLKARHQAAPACIRFNDAAQHPVARSMFEFHGIPLDAAALLLVLGPQEAPLGSLVCISEGARFAPEHETLIQPLAEPFMVALSNALTHREVVRLKTLLAEDNRDLRAALQPPTVSLIGEHGGLAHALTAAQRVAATDAAVLILGETGTGKDLMAQIIHQASNRRAEPLVTLNCGALPDSLLDSELFGHEAGAFTGASGLKRGRFERAHGGTLFLDEVGELSAQAQVRLLRALQNHEIERVGGTEPVPVNVRILAATHQPLEAMVRSGRFREDLYYRLNVFPIHLPPLRDRAEDLPALVQHFIAQKAHALGITQPPAVTPEALAELAAHPWPGNVRELAHVVERALILQQDQPTLDFGAILKGHTLQTPGHHPQGSAPASLETAIRQHIERALAFSKGQIAGAGGAAALLGVNPSTLRSKMKKLGLR